MISEHDLDTLETLLDGELPDQEADAIRRRLSAEPQLAQALDQLRAQRDVRQQIWRAMEPAESDVVSLVSGVRTAVRQDEVWGRRRRALQYVSGLAACILAGFFFGRYVPYGSSSSGDRGGGVIFDTPTGSVVEVVDRGPSRGATARPGEFKVLLTDSQGRVIAEQRFSTLDEAREFTDDLNRLHGARPVRVSDTIFKKDQF